VAARRQAISPPRHENSPSSGKSGFRGGGSVRATSFEIAPVNPSDYGESSLPRLLPSNSQPTCRKKSSHNSKSEGAKGVDDLLSYLLAELSLVLRRSCLPSDLGTIQPPRHAARSCSYPNHFSNVG